MFLLFKIWANSILLINSAEKDEKKSFSFYEEAFQGFMEIEPDSDFMFPYEPKFDGQIMKPVNMRSYVWYRTGKMQCYGLGTEQNYEKAFQWFLKSAQEDNKFAQYSLANLCYYGTSVEKDLPQAFLWYQKSSSQGSALCFLCCCSVVR